MDTKQDVLNAEERATVNIYRGRVVAGGLVATIDRLAGRVRDLEEALREMVVWHEGGDGPTESTLLGEARTVLAKEQKPRPEPSDDGMCHCEGDHAAMGNASGELLCLRCGRYVIGLKGAKP